MRNTCLGLPTKAPDKHAEMDEYGKANGLTVVFAPWHLNPEYRIFKTGSLLSRNERYPSGLVIVNERGTPLPWKGVYLVNLPNRGGRTHKSNFAYTSGTSRPKLDILSGTVDRLNWNDNAAT